MATRGPKPTPGKLHAIEGGKSPNGPTDPADSQIGLQGPGPGLQPEIPDMPEVVAQNPDAVEVWERLMPELLAAGLIAKIFEGVASGFCVAYGRWCKAERELEKTDFIVKSPNGYPMHSPYLAIANKAMEQMRQFGSELGLSPSALTRVTRGKQLDLFDDFGSYLDNA